MSVNPVLSNKVIIYYIFDNIVASVIFNYCLESKLIVAHLGKTDL